MLPVETVNYSFIYRRCNVSNFANITGKGCIKILHHFECKVYCNSVIHFYLTKYISLQNKTYFNLAPRNSK